MTVKEMAAFINNFCEHRSEHINDCCKDCPIDLLCDAVDGDFAKDIGICTDAYMVVKEEVSEYSNNVNHPAHYHGKHECIDEMIALFGVEAVKAFCKCNVYKYRFRAANKNGQEDLDKADWYMDKLMELEGEKHD